MLQPAHLELIDDFADTFDILGDSGHIVGVVEVVDHAAQRHNAVANFDCHMGCVGVGAAIVAQCVAHPRGNFVRRLAAQRRAYRRCILRRAPRH